MNILLNIAGIVAVIGILFAFSYHKRKINWILIIKALAAQIILAVIVLKLPLGVTIIETISNGIIKILSYGKIGLTSVFGPLMDVNTSGFIFLCQVLLNIIFIAALINVLQYVGILGILIKYLGKAVGKICGTSSTESFISVADMFLGQTESPLLIHRYIPSLNQSEIMVVLIAGMGSMSVSILGGYHALGVPMDFLIIASALVPFGSIMTAKILLPQTDDKIDDRDIVVDRKSCGGNLIESLGNGALDGTKMIIAIAASLVAIISFVALINGCLSPLDIKLEEIMGWIFYPLAFLMGLGDDFTFQASQIIGTKLVLNEFIAFDTLCKTLSALDYRTQAMLCITISGFANVGSMAISISALGTLCPSCKPTVSRLILRALAGAFLMNILNGLLVGLILAF